MALTTNTTKTVKKASTALGGKCEETQKNLAKLMKEAGCADAKKVKTMIPQIPGSKDDVAFVGLNGVSFYFLRGKTVEVPEPVLSILQNCGMV